MVIEGARHHTTCPLCFAAGTPIHTDHGNVPVESINVDDEVLSRNSSTGKVEYRRVTALTPKHKDTLVDLRVEGEAATLRPSTDHPFWVKRGDRSDGAWMIAEELRLGDLLQTTTGDWKRIAAITREKEAQTVYNFTVDEDHDYFVGETGFLVHNEDCPCNWGNPGTLLDHFERHGADFGLGSAAEYANAAAQFLIASRASGLPTKIDRGGVIRTYEPSTNTFGSYNPDGTTRTFYKPKRGEPYWNDQRGRPPCIP